MPLPNFPKYYLFFNICSNNLKICPEEISRTTFTDQPIPKLTSAPLPNHLKTQIIQEKRQCNTQFFWMYCEYEANHPITCERS
ncbi:hypothetical protein FGIG_06851 [Fasciola gigantica]|uniref:Uncharacterized protein n=1 Tax=Fasciola gigantica TaxID=46835 RepID=A0A504Z099_FASGI|nr:hypothetical protein FGIG_06851 [Fasciola gigantica]